MTDKLTEMEDEYEDVLKQKNYYKKLVKKFAKDSPDFKLKVIPKEEFHKKH